MCAKTNKHKIYGLLAVVLLLLVPSIWLLASGFLLNLLTQICIAVLICASLRLLVGSGGILNFGQMLYVGAGAYAAAYAVNAASSSTLFVFLPLPLIPFISGLFAMVLAIPLGWLCVRSPNRIYMAMISLALCELVYVLGLVWPQVFGDEMGIQFDRTAGNFWGIDFADPRWMTLIALMYLGGLLWFLYSYAKTPAGRWLEAARDDEVLVNSLGMNPKKIRRMAFGVSSFVCGVAGGLLAIEMESVNVSLFSVSVSGEYLIFAYLGGLSSLLGSVLGGIFMQVSNLWLPMLTPAWQLYLGLLFIYMVIYWPDGLVGCLRLVFLKGKRHKHTQKSVSWLEIFQFFVAASGVVCCTEAAYRMWGVDNTYRTEAVSHIWIMIGLLGFLSLFAVWFSKKHSMQKARGKHDE